jgi:rubrerythrin
MENQQHDSTTRSPIRRAFAAIVDRVHDRSVIEECRRCGTTLESATACPACGGTDIVEYRIE